MRQYSLKLVCPRYCKTCGKEGVSKGRRYHIGCGPSRVKGGDVVTVVCVTCGAARLQHRDVKRGNPKWCRGCYKGARRGSENSNWKGGITPINSVIRNSPEYKTWRISVFTRDNFTCVWCDQHGGKLNADHIQPFSTHPDLRFELSNGRTLCIACHKATPSHLRGGLKLKRDAKTKNVLARTRKLLCVEHTAKELAIGVGVSVATMHRRLQDLSGLLSVSREGIGPDGRYLPFKYVLRLKL